MSCPTGQSGDAVDDFVPDAALSWVKSFSEAEGLRIIGGQYNVI